MQMTMVMKLKQKPELKMVLPMEQIGDIPLLSLHRIKNLLKKKPITVSKEIAAALIGSLLSANREYKEEVGKDWNCLTSNHLVFAIEEVENYLKKVIDTAISSLSGIEEQKKPVKEILESNKEANIKKIQEWFFDNYDSLLYDTKGHVPWLIVQRLRNCLSTWIATSINPFGRDIAEAILEVAKEQGIDAETAEDAWIKMGGRLFKQKEEENED
ncbi:MAG: hypothetical protein PHN39_03150 [Candidatus Pacebacteria bacterium]|nr:hypothetical protein [Candidatus Paceibacterota bacterium]